MFHAVLKCRYNITAVDPMEFYEFFGRLVSVTCKKENIITGDLYGGPPLSRQNLFTYGKINFATAKSFSPRQNHFHSRQNLFTHGKINFATAKSISLTAKSISPRQNLFTHGKINFATAKSFPLTVKSFWLTCSRDISSQIAMGVNPTWRSSSWFLGSTCIAQTVENIVLATTHFCVQCRQGKP